MSGSRPLFTPFLTEAESIDLDAALGKRRFELEIGELRPVFQRDRSNGPAPQPHFGHRAHASSPHVHSLADPEVAFRRRDETRFLSFPL